MPKESRTQVLIFAFWPICAIIIAYMTSTPLQSRLDLKPFCSIEEQVQAKALSDKSIGHLVNSMPLYSDGFNYPSGLEVLLLIFPVWILHLVDGMRGQAFKGFFVLILFESCEFFKLMHGDACIQSQHLVRLSLEDHSKLKARLGQYLKIFKGQIVLLWR